jgi:AraC-like DNA-binding protein
MYNLDVMDLGVVITAGGRAHCLPGAWSREDELIHEAKIYHALGGRGWIRIAGITYRLNAGHLYLIPPHVRLSFGTPSEFIVEWCHFRLHPLSLDRRLGSLGRVLRFNRVVTARWAPVCRLVERFIKGGSTSDAFRIHAMTMELVGLTIDSLPEESPQQARERERLLPALRLLDSRATNPPSLREIARTANLSPEHFHRLFYANFHTTPHRYVLGRRMAMANTLLSEGRLNVKEVAERCGYSDSFYFSRVFRQFFGASPGRVRRGYAVIGPLP